MKDQFTLRSDPKESVLHRRGNTIFGMDGL